MHIINLSIFVPEFPRLPGIGILVLLGTIWIVYHLLRTWSAIFKAVSIR